MVDGKVVYVANHKRYVVAEVQYDRWSNAPSDYRAHRSYDNIIDAQSQADRYAAQFPDDKYVVLDTEDTQ